MFICDDCLDKNYSNYQSMWGSYGSCECCHQHKMCSDIHHSKLKLKAISESAFVTNLRQKIEVKRAQIQLLKQEIDSAQREIEGHLNK